MFKRLISLIITIVSNRVMRVSHYLDGNGRNCSFSGAVAR